MIPLPNFSVLVVSSTLVLVAGAGFEHCDFWVMGPARTTAPLPHDINLEERE